jgi:hypothetical protein
VPLPPGRLVNPLPSPTNFTALTVPETFMLPLRISRLSLGVLIKNLPSALLPLQPNFDTDCAPVVSKNSIADFDCAEAPTANTIIRPSEYKNLIFIPPNTSIEK